MPRVVENLVYGLGLLVFGYVVLLLLMGLIEHSSPWFFWGAAAACAAGILAGTYAAFSHPENVPGSDVYFVLALAGVLALAFFANTPHWRSLGTAGELLAWAVVVGVPLGLWASRYLKSEFRPLAVRDVVAGVVTGMLGVVLAMVVLTLVIADQFGLRLHVPVARITTFDLLGSGPVMEQVRLYLGMIPLLPVLLQGAQSGVAAFWDTVLLAAGALATTALGRTILLRTAILQN